MSDTAYRRCIVALTALLGSVLLLWAFLMPGFRAPDEPQHYNSIMRVATGGGWPPPGSAMLSGATLTALGESGSALSFPRGLPRYPGQFAATVPIEPDQRSVVDHERAPLVGTDQMTQHPPLYYALGAGVVKVFGALDWRWDQQLALLRLLSVALCLCVVPLAGATARAFSGSNVVGVSAAAMLIGIGQFTHINSTVTNDVLVTALGFALTYLAARALTRQHTIPLVLTTGLVLGLGLFTKGFFLAAIPMVALSFLLRTDQNPNSARRWASVGAVALIAFAFGGWWWVRNVLVYGTVQPAGQVVEYPPGDPTPTVPEFVWGATPRLAQSFFGNFGWLEIPLPSAQVWLMAIVSGLLVAGALFAAHRRRRNLLVLLSFPAATAALVLYGAFSAYLRYGLFPGLQGRYLFIALGALVTAAAFAATALVHRLAPRVVRYLPSMVLVVSLISAAFSLFWALQAVYQPLDQTLLDALVRWDSWSMLSRPGIAIILLLPVVLGMVALVVLLLAARQWNPADALGLEGRHSADRLPDESSGGEPADTERDTRVSADFPRRA